MVRSDGSVFFTDPATFDVESELDLFGVYRVTPDLSRINLLVRDFVLPNGLAFSPDESVLYISDSRRGHIRAFDVEPNGTLALATDRVFCELDGEGPGVPDGMKVDVEGNVYCTGPGGIWIIAASGKLLGRILTGPEPPSNVAWGEDDWKTLFYTTRHRPGQDQAEDRRRACALRHLPDSAPQPATRRSEHLMEKLAPLAHFPQLLGSPYDHSSSDGQIWYVPLGLPGPSSAPWGRTSILGCHLL